MKFTSAIALVIVFLFLAAASMGCVPTSPTPTPTAIHVEDLRFQDPETQGHYDALNQCVNKIIDASWTTIPFHLNGNFYRSTWCAGSGVPSDCRMASSTENHRDQHIIGIYTLMYPQDPSTVFGLGMDALWVPPQTGWGAHFSFSENGENIIGDSWGVIFTQYTSATDQPGLTTGLSSYAQYQVLETYVGYSFDLPLRDDLAVYLRSPEAMRDRRLEQIQALAQKVNTTIQTHQATTCDYGPYLGGGIPPKCTPRPLTTEEETAELAKADLYFSEQTRIMNENYPDLYAAWMRAFPMDTCWP